MPSNVELLFWLIFNRCLLPPWNPRTQKTKPPLQGDYDSSKNRFLQMVSMFDWFGCQHGLVLAFKVLQNSFINRFQDASFFWSMFASIFSNCGFVLGPKLKPFWQQFLLKWWGLWDAALLFVGPMLFFVLVGILDSSWPDLGSMLEELDLHFGNFWDACWRVLATIWVPFGLWFLYILKLFFFRAPQYEALQL